MASVHRTCLLLLRHIDIKRTFLVQAAVKSSIGDGRGQMGVRYIRVDLSRQPSVVSIAKSMGLGA